MPLQHDRHDIHQPAPEFKTLLQNEASHIIQGRMYGCSNPGQISSAAPAAPTTATPAPSTPTRSVKILYLCSGASRKCDLKSQLWEEGLRRSIEVDVIEYDLKHDEKYDLSDDAVWAQVRNDIEAGIYQMVFVSPSCSTHSRATYRPQGTQAPAIKVVLMGLSMACWRQTSKTQLLQYSAHKGHRSM